MATDLQKLVEHHIDESFSQILAAPKMFGTVEGVDATMWTLMEVYATLHDIKDLKKRFNAFMGRTRGLKSSQRLMHLYKNPNTAHQLIAEAHDEFRRAVKAAMEVRPIIDVAFCDSASYGIYDSWGMDVTVLDSISLRTVDGKRAIMAAVVKPEGISLAEVVQVLNETVLSGKDVEVDTVLCGPEAQTEPLIRTVVLPGLTRRIGISPDALMLGTYDEGTIGWVMARGRLMVDLGKG